VGRIWCICSPTEFARSAPSRLKTYPEAQLISAPLRAACPLRVIYLISSAHKGLPLSCQLQTYRCIVLSGAQGYAKG
jgi:hypothetical protein